MPASERFDAVIIGAGQGGGPLAAALAAAGRRTALVERAHVGGTCVNYGCTPTKTMIASARVAHLARRAGDYGVRTGSVSVDLERVRRRKRDIVERFRGGDRKRLEGRDGLELIRGQARFTGERRLEVHGGDGPRELTADLVVIDTGASPLVPDLPGLDGVSWLDSTTVMELDAVPEHLLVLGGGYVGVEFGQAFRRYGSRVTIVQDREQLLPREDPDLAEALLAVFRDEGIEVRLGARAVAARGDGGRIVLELEQEGGRGEVVGSHLLLAVGRRPNTEGLGLDAAGVRTGPRGHIEVDEGLRTSAEGVYALGDVAGSPPFTHMSYDDYRILKGNLLDGGERTTAGRLLCYTVFTDPQLGRVGLSEREARRQGLDVRVATLPGKRIARALETDETAGLLKAVVAREGGRILGFACLGPQGGEVMSVVEVAMLGGLPWTALRDAVFAHPTWAEALNNLFGRLD